ncbi:hypothetical protein RchiOBHm_Chr1g0331191 [Rosa chinensis]|uniref:Uncharacterized protein n=1 Tax=Rosa chinensis TaxID=74649 RepID=A0A2P6SBG3_ROSCH|nr:hypothetical protein RchiOBHm_Chr1g0331191 [Rosa chinensis]
MENDRPHIPFLLFFMNCTLVTLWFSSLTFCHRAHFDLKSSRAKVSRTLCSDFFVWTV